MRPVRRGVGWRAYAPGVLILLALTVVSCAVFFLDTIRRMLLEGPHIVVLAAEARGLVPGADVWIAGSPSGRVRGVEFGDPDGPAERRVVIHATLHRAAVPYLRRDTRAHISSSALLAPVVLKLDPHDPSSGPFNPSDTLFVPPHETVEQFLALAGAGRAALDSLRDLLAPLDRRLADGPGTIAALRADSSLRQRLPELAANARVVSRAVQADDGLLALLASDSLGSLLMRVGSGLRALAGADSSRSVAGSTVELAAELERLSQRLARMDDDLRAGRGTAGRGLYDDELQRQRELAGTRLDSLRLEIRRTPWRWVRLRLF